MLLVVFVVVVAIVLNLGCWASFDCSSWQFRTKSHFKITPSRRVRAQNDKRRSDDDDDEQGIMIGHGAMQTSSVYVCNLPPGTNETLLSEHFGQIGLVKKDRRTGRPKIWIYYDKSTNEPKGDATVTYEDPHAASAAVEWFDNKDFHGNLIRVSIAESRFKDTAEQPAAVYSEQAPVAMDPVTTNEFPLEPDYGAADNLPGDATMSDASGPGRGRGRGDIKWQQEGDWPCPNPSCNNINFSFRGVCNRCNAARPAGGAGGGGAGGGRGRGRGAEAGGRGRGATGGLFGPNDWHCPMCANVNWAKRTKCNICNTTKPGHNEGGVREGRAGGYKELDEAELEATKRRRREIEDDDGEMYDEFGNLKKKFRLRAKQGEAPVGQNQAGSGLGSAGWDKEELGVIEKDSKRERSSNSGSSNRDANRGEDRSNGYEREPEHDRRRERDHEKDKDRDRRRDRERARSKERDRERESDRDRDRRR